MNVPSAVASREKCAPLVLGALCFIAASALHTVASAQEPAPAPDALTPTQEDYATARGELSPGVHPREYYFEPANPRNEVGFSIGVPIWFRHGVDPGVSMEGRYGARFGAFVPELMFGWQINWLDRLRLDNADGGWASTLDSFYLSGGVRAYLLPDAMITPFISGAVDFSMWHLRGDTQTFCGYYSCGQIPDYEPNIGFSGRLGLAAAPAYGMQIELALRLAMALPFGPFEHTLAWLTPYFGSMWRF
jgi:hypothetical protein